MSKQSPETLWSRGWAEWRFVLLEAVVSPIVGFIVGIITDDAVLGFAAGIGVVLVGLGSIWIGATASAPVKQRNEARAESGALRAQIEAERRERSERAEKRLSLIVHMQKAHLFVRECEIGSVPQQADVKAWADSIGAWLANNLGPSYWNTFSMKSAGLQNSYNLDLRVLCRIIHDLTELLEHWNQELAN